MMKTTQGHLTIYMFLYGHILLRHAVHMPSYSRVSRPLQTFLFCFWGFLICRLFPLPAEGEVTPWPIEALRQHQLDESMTLSSRWPLKYSVLWNGIHVDTSTCRTIVTGFARDDAKHSPCLSANVTPFHRLQLATLTSIAMNCPCHTMPL
jgi:hypothetical protein